MKIKLKNLLGVALILSILAISPLAVAHNASADDNSSSSSTSDTETMSRDERLANLKTKFKIALGLSAKNRIKERCVNAQSLVGKLNTKFGNSVTRRTQAYTELSKNLDKLVDKLQTKGVDTTTLETQVKELNTKIATYTTDLTAYKLTLSDLKAVGCKEDPDAFKAALEAARAAHEKLVTDVTDIKTYLKDTIKPTLVTIRTSLEKDSTDDTTGGTQ